MTRHGRGFSLLELMVGITILSILVGIAVPSFREFTRNNAVTAAQNDLVTSLTLARSEALRRNRPVSVCASADGATCGDDTNWGTGWIAFTDRGAAGSIDGDDAALQVWERTDTTVAFSSGGAAFVQYLPTGMGAAPVTIDVSWTGCTGPHLRRVSILATGAVTGQTMNCP